MNMARLIPPQLLLSCWLMAPRCVFHCKDDQSLAKAIAAIRTITINGQPMDLTLHPNGVFVVKLGQSNLADETTHIQVDGSWVNHALMGIENVKIQDDTGSYAFHVPNGSFIRYDPQKPKLSHGAMPTISTLELAPSILSHFSITPPNYMVAASRNILT
jgi:hypothetical protein